MNHCFVLSYYFSQCMSLSLIFCLYVSVSPPLSLQLWLYASIEGAIVGRQGVVYPHELVPSENCKRRGIIPGVSCTPWLCLHPDVSASLIGWERARAPMMANEKS